MISFRINIVLIIISLISCTSNESEHEWISSDFSNLKSRITPLNNGSFESWKIEENRELDDHTRSVILSSTKEEIREVISFIHDDFMDSLEIIYYEKTFHDNGIKHFLEYKYDTIYYFIEDSVSMDRKFIVGEYYYRFKRGLLNGKENQFFLEKFDSLKKVRGDNLPPLINDYTH